MELGFRLGISIGLGIGAGFLVDLWLGTRPIGILLGVALGFAAAMMTIWNVARNEMRK
jgi:F0F1-type ATP synthase assembly protein I